METFNTFCKEEITELYSEISKGWNDRIAHVSRVYHLCKLFLKDYPGVNKKVLLTSALLHDIGHAKEGSHAENGAVMVKELLKKKNFNVDEIKHISECIRTHSLKGSKEPLTLEAKILSDCDRIDVVNIDNWLSILDSKNLEKIGILDAIQECVDWEKEWFNLGTKFFTLKGKRKYEEIQQKKEKLIEEIKGNSLKKIRRGILIHYFDENFENILLVKRAKENKWGIIAGTSEDNEEFIRTATRELKEESDVERFLFELFPSDIEVKVNLNENSLDVLHHYCTKKKEIDKPKINFPEEIGDITWARIEELPTNMIPTDIKSNLGRFIEYG